MQNRLKALTFLMIAIGALYAFDGLNQGALSGNSVTGMLVSSGSLAQQNVPCYDSNNHDYYTQGTTYAQLFEANGESPKQDTCEGATLIEYYCVNSEPQVEFYDCPGGCVNGRCVE